MDLRRLLPMTLITLLIFLVWAIPSTMANQSEDGELTALVKKAYVYSFPVYEMYRLRQGAVYDQTNPIRADLNHFGPGGLNG